MTERHYPAYSGPGRAATFQPARASMPSSLGYNPVYPGDIHYPTTAGSRYAGNNGASSRSHHHTTAPVSRGPGTATYAVTDDPLRRPRDFEPVPAAAPTATRTRRSSTVDSTYPRPIIITTTQPSARPHGHNSSRPRSRSPTRPEYRPSSSIRSSSVSRQPPGSAQPLYSPTFDTNDDDYMARLRGPDIIPASSRAEAYRHSRPIVVYPSNPRHSTIDLGDDYGYTKPGELLQYDLEHPKQHHRHKRHDSFDHYARPNIYYNPERRGFSIETNRTYEPTPGGKSESRGGPPPTTWGLDKLNRSSTVYDPVPPPAPIPPAPLRDAAPSSPRERRGSNRHTRPVSLYQDMPPRPYGDGFYRPQDESRHRREHREYDDAGRHHLDEEVFIDDNVRTRGFGIRTDTAPPTEPEDRHERRERERGRREHVESVPLRRSDDNIDREWERIDTRELEDKNERRRSKPRPAIKDDDEDLPPLKEKDGEPSKKLRDNLKAGLGIAASAIGLGPMVNKEGKESNEKGKERRESPERRERNRAARRPSDEADERDSSSDEVEIISARASDRRRPREKVYLPKEQKERADPPEPGPVKDGRREADSSPVAGEGSSRVARGSPHAEEEADRSRRRERLPSFNPNDTDDLRDIQKKLAALNVSEKQDKTVVVEPPGDGSREESTREERSVSSRREPSRGRDLVLSNPEEKAVRVVSPPPNEKAETKPIKGILKAPSSKFPEDPNPIREGVAPHKNDEKLKEVPPGARWTRISRKIVNPEALDIGKERFEVRDDFVIVLRVLSKEEIQAYAAATTVLRERRRKEYEKSKGRDVSDEEVDDDRRRPRRHRERDDRDDDVDGGEDDRERRHRRHRRYDEEEDEARRHQEHRHHRRSFRERERERDLNGS
ncbi:hypothetical protein jhhlp_004026 [Lomentospora prolificans]|uniref:DUF8035 domain-containing protein n=1 Tax=Lomentospora prolificans TaxID=41688 RepID=A0A2N3NAH3_9PEZI|nr:hypothetical protein jhhlp_004026 [Lomentospora prolificans]